MSTFGALDERELVAAARSGDEEEARRLLSEGPMLRPRHVHRMGAINGREKAAPLKRDDGSITTAADEAAFADEAVAALAEATLAGHAEVVQILLHFGADIHAEVGGHGGCAAGSTIFHLACRHDHAGCVDAIVRTGCHMDLRDGEGRTGKDLAETNGCAAVLALLAGPLEQRRREINLQKKVRVKKEKRKRALLVKAIAEVGHGARREHDRVRGGGGRGGRVQSRGGGTLFLASKV